jgi:hypothetical protein
MGLMISDRFGPSDLKQRAVEHEAGMLANSCALMFGHNSSQKLEFQIQQYKRCFVTSIYLLLHYPLHA